MNNEDIRFTEYGEPVCGCIRKVKPPKCPQCIIPVAIVETVDNIRKFSGCFVHVSNINTTYYIDDHHRTVIAWAGPVEVNNYDYETNPLRLRSQVVYDFEANKQIYFNKVGDYRIVELGAE